MNIYIDPYNLKKKYSPADIIFITHSHYDHLSKEDIKKIIKPT
jgi:L-ascorbate metabolism protein UlaG (beta-lactamase superfamily)